MSFQFWDNTGSPPALKMPGVMKVELSRAVFSDNLNRLSADAISAQHSYLACPRWLRWRVNSPLISSSMLTIRYVTVGSGLVVSKLSSPNDCFSL